MRHYIQKLSNHHTKIIVFLFPITLFLIFLSIKIVAPDTYRLAVQEDSVIEYLQAFFYFLASTVSFRISIRFFKKHLNLHSILYAILAVGLLFVFLEEISWGQRILNIEIPDYFVQHNVQNEISFHNLDAIQPLLYTIFMLIGLYGTFAWLFVSAMKLERIHIVNLVVPDWFISSYFFFVLFIYTVFVICTVSVTLFGINELRIGGFIIWRDQEPAELLLSLGFLAFVMANNIKSRKICQ